MGGVANASEDCLYLNVYTPTSAIPPNQESGGLAATRAGSNTSGLPVLIYFPAGQFMWGSGDDAENFNAPPTAAGATAIVVTMNYRLGALGLLPH